MWRVPKIDEVFNIWNMDQLQKYNDSSWSIFQANSVSWSVLETRISTWSFVGGIVIY